MNTLISPVGAASLSSNPSPVLSAAKIRLRLKFFELFVLMKIH